MRFELKKLKNGTKNIFRDKETTKKLLLIILDVKEPTER